MVVLFALPYVDLKSSSGLLLDLLVLITRWLKSVSLNLKYFPIRSFVSLSSLIPDPILREAIPFNLQPLEDVSSLGSFCLTYAF